MKVRALLFAAIVPLTAAVGCSDYGEGGNGFGTGLAGGPSGSTATVRFVNATGNPLDVATNGVVAAGDAGVSYGGTTSCILVNPIAPGLSVRAAGTTTALGGFAPSLTAGGSYTVVAYLDEGGATRFATINGGFVPTSGSAGLRVFNGAPGFGSFDAYVTAPGAALGAASVTAVTLGGASNFFNVPNGSEQVRFANTATSTVSLDAGATNFVSGQTSTIVLAPPLPGSTTLRSFFAPGC